MEYLLRACLLATRLAERLGLANQDPQAVYYTALPRWVGCTGHAHEAPLLFGDEISARARLAVIDTGNPADMVRLGVRDLGAGRGVRGRMLAIAQSSTAELGPQGQFRASCQVAQLLSEQLGMDAPVRRALWHAFERWDGHGVPEHVRGDAVEIAARVVLVAQDAEIFQRLEGVHVAVEIVRRRSSRAYDPAVAKAFCAEAPALFEDLNQGSAWERVLAHEPTPQQVLSGATMDSSLDVVADYVDLKSPRTAGHSRGVAELGMQAAAVAGMSPTECAALGRAGLVHDLGRCGVHNGIWDRPGPLTDAEWERVRLHPYLTGRLLARCPALAPLAQVAAAHHERANGSGYHRGVRAPDLSPAMRLLAAADAYQAMTQPRPHRPALLPSAAAVQLRDDVRSGRQDGAAVEAVLVSAGHRRHRRGLWPAGLSPREPEVLRLVARGLPNRETARLLTISERTVAHHIQHVYDKIGVSTRGAVVLYALQHDLVDYASEAPGV
jgi:HD-GYP domain-containing protein (c-di-GMP phosphodiesterase class II)